MSLGVERRPVESGVVAEGRALWAEGTAGAKTRGRIKPDKFDHQPWHSCVWIRSGRHGGMHTIN